MKKKKLLSHQKKSQKMNVDHFLKKHNKNEFKCLVARIMSIKNQANKILFPLLFLF